MKMALKTGFALKAGTAALALSLLAGNAWAASCARPQDVTALRTAALQQQLMVAALACHDSAAYNRFVTSYQGELQKSDRALMNFFVRQDAHKGTDDYNAYKTWLANAASLRSLRDPQFCRSAKIAFDVAFNRKGSLEELAAERPPRIEIGYASCAQGAPEPTLMADARPNLPARHQPLLDSLPSASIIAPALASRPDRALPAVSPQRDARSLPQRSFNSAQAGRISAPPHGNADGPRTAEPLQARDTYERDAYNRDADARDAYNRDADERDGADAGNDAPRYAPRYAEAPPPRTYDRDDNGYGDNAGDNSGNGEGTDNDPDADTASAYRDGYSAPYAYRPYAYGRQAYEPPARPRLVRGPYGRWYLLPPYGR